MATSTASRGSSYKRKDGKIADKFKEVCPPHKIKDLDALVKACKGNEEKIQAEITAWWEEPQTVEPEWEAVDKKGSKRHTNGGQRHGGGSGYRGGGGGRRDGPYRGPGGGGRGFHGRGMGGGRGSGPERRSREYGDRDRGNRPGQQQRSPPASTSPSGQAQKREPAKESGVPAPVTNVPRPKGAWGQGAAQSAVSTVGGPEKTEQPVNGDAEKAADVGVATAQDPTPAGLVDTASKTKPEALPVVQPKSAEPSLTAPVAPAVVTGNVWATKGSAHLIEAEKPKPPPVQPVVQKQPHVQETKAKRDRGGSRPSRGNKQDVPHEPTKLDKDESVATEPDVVSAPAASPAEKPTPPAADALESVLPPSVNGANINADGWKPRSDAAEPSSQTQAPSSTIEITKPSPVGPVAVPSVPPVSETTIGIAQEASLGTVESKPLGAPAAPEAPVSTGMLNVLNLGAWEGKGDEEQTLDIGFGSFGPDNDVASVDETTISSSTNNNIAAVDTTTTTSQPVSAPTDAAPPAAAATVSPARPPPGLTMPPMPKNAILVHELEGKLENASLSKKAEESATSQADKAVESLQEKKPLSGNMAAGTQTAPPQSSIAATPAESASAAAPQGAMSQNYTAAYGMYNYNAANVAPGAATGFVNMPSPGGPVLAAGGIVPPQQQKPQQQTGVTGQQAGAGQGTTAQPLNQPQQQQGGLYGAPAAAANVGATGTDTSGTSSNEGAASAAGIPPGMPGAAMPYNPALFYGQQPYQMGQPHGGVGYGYGYGQFGGAVQGGFGYQQVMGQSGGYGQPYDDQPPQQHHGSHGSHHSGSSHQGGYQKGGHGGGGGYRGRNSHQGSHGSGHHYQNQYNPQQHGGYGGQPYNMGYNVDHFNQRGGYGPGGMDPYSMQQGSGGYQSGGIGHSSGGGFSNQGSGDQQPQQQQGKGKSKGGNNRGNTGFGGGNPNIQFQQQAPPQQGGQSQQQAQPFGGIASEGSGASNAGWSAQNWGGPSWQGS